jgi:hypothetical protein
VGSDGRLNLGDVQRTQRAGGALLMATDANEIGIGAAFALGMSHD